MSTVSRTLTLVFGAFLLAGSVTPNDAFAKKNKDKSAEQEAAGTSTIEIIEIEATGIAAFDDVFMKAKDINTKLTDSNTAITTANTGILTALGLTEGTPIGDAVAQMKKDAPGMFTVSMDGTKPKVDVKPEAPDNVKAAVDAMNIAADALVGTAANLAGIPAEAKDLIDACKAFPSQVPAAVKSAGLKPTDIPKIAKIVTKDAKATTQIPANTKALVDSTVNTLNIIKSLAE